MRRGGGGGQTAGVDQQTASFAAGTSASVRSRKSIVGKPAPNRMTILVVVVVVVVFLFMIFSDTVRHHHQKKRSIMPSSSTVSSGDSTPVGHETGKEQPDVAQNSPHALQEDQNDPTTSSSHSSSPEGLESHISEPMVTTAGVSGADEQKEKERSSLSSLFTDSDQLYYRPLVNQQSPEDDFGKWIKVKRRNGRDGEEDLEGRLIQEKEAYLNSNVVSDWVREKSRRSNTGDHLSGSGTLAGLRSQELLFAGRNLGEMPHSGRQSICIFHNSTELPPLRRHHRQKSTTANSNNDDHQKSDGVVDYSVGGALPMRVVNLSTSFSDKPADRKESLASTTNNNAAERALRKRKQALLATCDKIQVACQGREIGSDLLCDELDRYEDQGNTGGQLLDKILLHAASVLHLGPNLDRETVFVFGLNSSSSGRERDSEEVSRNHNKLHLDDLRRRIIFVDLGSGVGVSSLNMWKRGFSVLAIDALESNVRLLRQSVECLNGHLISYNRVQYASTFTLVQAFVVGDDEGADYSTTNSRAAAKGPGGKTRNGMSAGQILADHRRRQRGGAGDAGFKGRKSEEKGDEGNDGGSVSNTTTPTTSGLYNLINDRSRRCRMISPPHDLSNAKISCRQDMETLRTGDTVADTQINAAAPAFQFSELSSTLPDILQRWEPTATALSRRRRGNGWRKGKQRQQQFLSDGEDGHDDGYRRVKDRMKGWEYALPKQQRRKLELERRQQKQREREDKGLLSPSLPDSAKTGNLQHDDRLPNGKAAGNGGEKKVGGGRSGWKGGSAEEILARYGKKKKEKKNIGSGDRDLLDLGSAAPPLQLLTSSSSSSSLLAQNKFTGSKRLLILKIDIGDYNWEALRSTLRHSEEKRRRTRETQEDETDPEEENDNPVHSTELLPRAKNSKSSSSLDSRHHSFFNLFSDEGGVKPRFLMIKVLLANLLHKVGTHGKGGELHPEDTKVTLHYASTLSSMVAALTSVGYVAAAVGLDPISASLFEPGEGHHALRQRSGAEAGKIVGWCNQQIQSPCLIKGARRALEWREYEIEKEKQRRAHHYLRYPQEGEDHSGKGTEKGNRGDKGDTDSDDGPIVVQGTLCFVHESEAPGLLPWAYKGLPPRAPSTSSSSSYERRG